MTLSTSTAVAMNEQKLFEASAKLVKVIKTRDEGRVANLVQILERQRDSMLTVEIFVRVNRYLEKTDQDLQKWFHSVYFQDCSPEYKKMWLEFVDLCSLSILTQSAA